MIGLPSGTKIWIVAGITDMRNGFNGLAAKVENAVREDPFCGHVFVFGGRRGNTIKLLWSTGDGLCLLSKRLERGRFAWPRRGRVRCFLPRRNWPCCSKASTGGNPKGLLTPCLCYKNYHPGIMPGIWNINLPTIFICLNSD